MSDNNTGGVSAEQTAAAFRGLSEVVEQTATAFRIAAENFERILRKIAAKLERQHELKTALRWAAVCNRPLYDRHRHAKKLRIRKKYEKRILRGIGRRWQDDQRRGSRAMGAQGDES